MNRRRFLAASAAATLVPGLAHAHSPWGQYAVYRQKHLLVLSTRDDAPSYPYSKRLVEAINLGAPEASARPARARDLRRAYDLLRSDQFQFALLSRPNVDAMRTASGPFAGGEKVPLSTIYQFSELYFVVRTEFPENLVAVVADAVLTHMDALPEARPPQEVAQLPQLHSGARWAIDEFLDHTHRN